jgi:serine/threonine protein kinase
MAQIIDGRYHVTRRIRKGIQYAVFEAYDQVTRSKVAVRVPHTFEPSVEEEVCMLESVEHKNVVKILNYLPQAKWVNERTKKTKIVCVMVQELCGNGITLCDVVDETGAIAEQKAAGIMKQVLSAVRFLHQAKIVHHDIVPEHIAIDTQGIVKVSREPCYVNHINPPNQQLLDFGLAKQYEVMETTEYLESCYLPPNIQRMTKHDPRTDDMWACGVALFVMLRRAFPFFHDGLVDDPNAELWEHDKAAFWASRLENPTDLTENAKSLLEGLLDFDASKRLTAEQALEHKFFI